MSIKYCLACRIYLCDHHILINEKDEHIYDYNFKLTEKMHIIRKFLSSRNNLNFPWKSENCPYDHSMTFSTAELANVAHNKSLLKWLNLFHFAKISDKCRIGFYTGKHCGIIGPLMNSYHNDFTNFLYLFRYKNYSNSVLKDYPRAQMSEGLGQTQKRIFDPNRRLRPLTAKMSISTEMNTGEPTPGKRAICV